MTTMIRTPAQVEEAHALLERWRKLDPLLRTNETAEHLRDNFRHAVHANLGGALDDAELAAVRVQATTAAMAHVRALHRNVLDALLGLGVDPRAEEEKEDTADESA